MKSKQIKKQKKDKSRQKTKKLKQKQKQRQVQRQVVNVTSTSSGGSGGGGYPLLQPQPLAPYGASQSLESKIAEFKMLRELINVNDRDPEQKNIQENALNKMDENNIYNNEQDIAQQQNLQHIQLMSIPRFSSGRQKSKNISYPSSPLSFPSISLDELSADKKIKREPVPPSQPKPVPPSQPKSIKKEPKVTSVKKEEQPKVIEKKKVGRPKKEDQKK